MIKIIAIFVMLNTYMVNSNLFKDSPKTNVISQKRVGIKPFVVGDNLFNMKPIGYVYKITNLINGKIYFGITKQSIDRRWAGHRFNARKKAKKTHIVRAMSKYGDSNFKIELVKTCYSDFQLYNSEIYFIAKYNTTDRSIGYNNSIGGEVSTSGFKHSEETKVLISNLQKGIRKPNSGSFKKGRISIITEETKKKLSELNKGKKLSQQTKDKIRDYNIRNGVKVHFTQEIKDKISKSNTGKKRSKEQIERLSKLAIGNKYRLGKFHSDEVKQKISLSKTGSKDTLEAKKNKSIAAKLGWEKRRGKCL